MPFARPRRAAAAVSLVLASALLSACGSSSSPSATTAAPSATSSSSDAAATTSYPLTIENCGTEQTFTEPPKRVVILNGTSVAEVTSFIVLGIEDSIVGNAQSYGVSDDPTMVDRIAAVPTGGLSLNKNFDVPAEQVLALKPDLVVSTWSGGFDSSMGFATREHLAAAGASNLLNPVNCPYVKADASEQEKAAYANASVESSFEFLALLGEIFDVQGKAADVTTGLQARIEVVQDKVAALPTRTVLIAFPGMAMMTDNGVPAVFAGGVYDDVIRLAGGVNSFAGKDQAFLRTLNNEALAAASVDVLATGTFTPTEKPEDEAAKILQAFPTWEAAKNSSFVAVSDGIYLGPSNVYAIEKLAQELHPDAF